MIQSLPESANLEHLKGQAKELLRSLRSQEPGALSRAEGLPIATPYRLAHAQLAVAREYGFESWAKLKKHLTGYKERRTEFFAAIRAGDREQVRRILDEDRALARSRHPEDFGSTPLNTAAHRDDVKMIDLLLQHGADIDARSDWGPGGFGPLDFANEETSAFLLSRGATLTAHAAARLGKIAELRDIVHMNPSVVHERGGDGQFPLHFSKTAEIVDFLLDSGAEIDARDIDHEGTPLQNRILVEPVARRLLDRGARPDVFSAAALGEVAILSRLLDEDSEALTRRTGDPGNPWIPQPPGRHIYTYNLGFAQLHQVATNLRQDAAYELLWHRSTLPLRLSMAGWRGDRDAAEALRDGNPGIISTLTREDMQMLPAAAWQRRTETVKLLLDIGFDPNVRNGEDMTAIGCAGFHGFDDLIETILPYKPDLTIRNVYGGTPLTACMYGSLHGWRKDGDYPRSVELLLEAGSPVPEKSYGSPEVIAVLERFGVPTWPIPFR